MGALFKIDKTILLLLSLIYLIIGMSTHEPTMKSLALMGWLGIIQFVYSIMSWVKKGNQFLSPFVIFLVTLYVFSYGQSFLWALGLDTKKTLIGFYGVTLPEIFIAQVYSLIMLSFFQIGASYFLSQRSASSTISHYKVKDVTPRLKRIGWFLFIISVIPYAQMTIMRMMLSLAQGYGALYEGVEKIGFDNLAGFISDYFIPSLICLFISYRNDKFVRNSIILLLIGNIVAIMITGGRSNAVILIALLLIMYNFLVHKFTSKWLLVGAIGGFALLQLLAFVGTVRSEQGRSASIGDVKIENNAAVDAIAEMGGSMFCLIKTQNLVPEKYDFRYGKSYAFAFTTLIPNMGFWDIHPAKKESNLADWLTDALGMTFGTGFSMCSEAYINFGYFCFIPFFIWGYFFANIFGKIEISVKTRDLASLAFLLILFWFFLKLPRNNFINLVRPIFFIAGPVYLYCKNFKLRRS